MTLLGQARLNPAVPGQLPTDSWPTFNGDYSGRRFSPLTHIDTTHAGRAYAGYAAVYLVGALVWLRVVERVSPDRWDLIGGAISLVGCAVILFAPGTYA